jgi:hypothetical protein
MLDAEHAFKKPGGLVQHHWTLEYPSLTAGSGEDALAAFRKTREEVRGRLEALLEKSR